ncbi:MAG: acyl carrier protein [Kiritimatiellaeota bacterium]|nr:acyl carrier protein [Kiritimatiellota bacterium]
MPEDELLELKKKLKKLIIEELSLEDVSPDDIDDDAPLFGDGIGLDSLDAVELVVLLQRNFGIQIKDLEAGKKIFETLDSLARYVFEQKKS